MSDMAIQPAYIKHFIDIDEYHRMAAAGVFGPDACIELIDGELIERVGPIHPSHAGTVTKIANRFTFVFAELAHIRNQQPVTLGSRSEPQPDISLVRFDPSEYMKRHPSLADVFLLIEVCDATRAIDQRKKIPMYAREGVPEVWLIDLIDDCVRTYRRPQAGAYREIARSERGERLYALAFETTILEITDLLPPR